MKRLLAVLLLLTSCQPAKVEVPLKQAPSTSKIEAKVEAAEAEAEAAEARAEIEQIDTTPYKKYYEQCEEKYEHLLERNKEDLDAEREKCDQRRGMVAAAMDQCDDQIGELYSKINDLEEELHILKVQYNIK